MGTRLDRAGEVSGDDTGAASALKKAIGLHRENRLADATVLYREILQQNPRHADALHLLGAIEIQRKNPSAALELFDRAIEINPSNAAFFSNRGNALKDLKRADEALASFNRALAIKPDYAEALYNRANVLKALNRFDEALASYDRALAIKPDYAEALINRGNTLNELDRGDEALASFDRALAIRPRWAEALYNRANVLKDLRRFTEALMSYDRALAIKPDHAGALNNRGVALQALECPDEALKSYDRALAIEPQLAEALNNRGNVLSELKRLDEAVASFDRALAIKPDYIEARYNRGKVQLLSGDYRNGFKAYEHRWDTKDFLSRPPNLRAPKWQGEAIAGRSILIFSEQGLGDVIQFSRYLPLLVQLGANVTFLCPAKLVRLLKPLTQQIEVVTSLGGEERFDFQCALMTLPLRFGADPISSPAPYLRPEAELADRWRQRIGDQGFKIGIAWHGNQYARSRRRSVPLSEFIPLSERPGVRLISLQKHQGLDQLTNLSGATVEDLGDEFDSGPDAFIDTAAVMSGLDLIVTCDTSIAHLAGALGRPTWVALIYVPEWRWQLDRADTPWYPAMRLFRQQTRGEWSGAFRDMALELDALLGRV
jgi:tetratricopeptide (TPR) repeat protein